MGTDYPTRRILVRAGHNRNVRPQGLRCMVSKERLPPLHDLPLERIKEWGQELTCPRPSVQLSIECYASYQQIT